MHSVQASKSRHNIFSRVDHDQNYVKAHISPKKSPPVNNQSETKGLSSSSSLPSIDFHVRKKLASGDLAAKLHTKTGVLTVASTMGVEEGQSGMFQKSSRREQGDNSIFDYSEDGNQSFRSDTSEPSIRLENFKRNLAESLNNKDSTESDGFLEPGFDDEIIDDASFGPSITSPDYVSISKQDHTKFQSPLDAHKKFIKAVRSKNHSSSMKAVTSHKVIPTTSQKLLGYNNSFISSKSSMSHNDDASVASDISAASGLKPLANSNKKLGPKTSSFLFLSSVKSLAPTIFEEKGEEEEEDVANATVNGNSTLIPFASTENLAERAVSPSAKAPLESTSTPVVPKALRLRSFSRFNSSAEDNSRLMLRMLDSQKLTNSAKDNNTAGNNVLQQNSNTFSSPASKSVRKDTLAPVEHSHIFDDNSVASANNPSNLISQVLSPLAAITGGTSTSPATNSPQTQNDPHKKSLYHVPSLQEVRNKKKNFTDWIDEKIRAMTFVPAPPKPATPPPEEVPPVTLESLFGESLLHANVDKKAEPISDETYQRILRETHEKQKQMIEEQYRLHTINGNEHELIKELERDYHYREQQRLQELQQNTLPSEEEEHHKPVDPNEVYSSTYMEPLGIPPRKPMAVPKSSSKSIASSLGSEMMMMSTPAPTESTIPRVSSTGAILPKLDLTPVLQRQQQQQPYQPSQQQKDVSLPQKKSVIPRSETFLAASSFDLTAQGDDNASVLSFSSSITSLPGMANHSGKPMNAASGIGTRLPSIHQQKFNPTQSLFQSPESKHKPLPEQKERIVYHDPFSTMFAYTSDDIKHYTSALNPQTQKQLQRLYDTDPSMPKHSPEATHKALNPDLKSIFDIGEDLLQPLETTATQEPTYEYQHSTTSFVLKNWENSASKGIPDEAPSFATDPKALAKQDHDRIVEAMISQSTTGKSSTNQTPLPAKSPSKKREMDALNVLSATKLNRKLTLEDIDTTYSSLRHQSQMLTYSTTAQQELAQTSNDAEVKRIYSILNPGPHEAVIFLPPDHAKFAQEMRETYHSLPAGLLAYTQDKELMHEIERQTQQIQIPGQSPPPNNETTPQNETLSARDSRMKSLLSMPRIVSLQDQEGYDAHQAQQAYQREKNRLPGQADYAQEFVTATSYLLSAPGVVYSQPDFNQVRDQLHPMGGGGSVHSDHKHSSLPTTASHYAMTLRHPAAETQGENAMKRPPSMVTEFAQYLAEQRQQQQHQYSQPQLLPYLAAEPSATEHHYTTPQKSKPPLHPSTSMASSAGQPHHSKSQLSLLDGSKSVAGFNDEFFRAIPVVEESGLDDASVYSKDSFQKSKPSKTQPGTKPRAESFDEDEEEDDDDGDNSYNEANNVPIHRLGQQQKPAQQQSQMSMTPSMLDLRSDILAFMAKANSHMTHEYAGYLDPQLNKSERNAQNATSIIHQSRVAATNPSGASMASQPTVQSSLPEEHQHLTKLWDQLRSRYAGDKEGAHEMKKKIRTYIHQGIKEETQVNRAYMEEMEDW